MAALLRAGGERADTRWQRVVEEAKESEREWKSARRERPDRAGVAAVFGITPAAREAADAGPGTFSVRAPYGELPGRVRGRDELLAALERDVTEGSDRIQVLHGLGGCGKTTVALRLARFAQGLGRHVFWISGASRDRLSTGMRQVSRELGVPEHDIDAAWSGRSSATDLVWRALDGADRPWLLVVDNLDEPSVAASVDGVVGDGTGWIRSSAAGLTVVTSRVGNPLLWGGSAACRPVDTLTPEDGAAVLVDLAGAAGSEADARQLAEQLGGLPLALRLAGSYLARTRRGVGLLTLGDGRRSVHDFAGYARELERLGAELLDRGEPQGGSADERRLRRLVGHTWEMSLDLLAGQGIPEARLVMRLLSCFGRAPFPMEFLRVAMEHDTELVPGGAERGEAAIEALVDVCLLGVEDIPISFDHDTQADMVLACLTAHPLVLETNAFQIRNAPERTRTRLWRKAAVIATWSRLSAHPETWKIWQHLMPHVRAGLRQVPDAPEGLLVAFLLTGISARNYASASNNHTLSRELASALAERAAALPEGHPTRLAAQRAHYDRWDDVDRSAEAHEMYEAHLRYHGADHEATLSARLTWANALRRAGQVTEAEEELRAMVEAEGRLARSTSVEVIADLVRVLVEQGKTDEAGAEARELLAALDGHGVDLDIRLAHQAAHALDAAGLLAEAETYYRSILVQLQDAREEGSPLYRDMTRHLADNLVRQDRTNDAVDLLGGLLNWYRASPAGATDRVQTLLRLADKRARLQMASDQAERAEAELRDLLTEEFAGLDSADAAVLRLRLLVVNTLLAQKRPTDAERVLDEAERDLTEIGGNSEVPRWALPLWRARCRCAHDRCDQAVVIYDEVIAAVADNQDLAASITAEAEECRQALADPAPPPAPTLTAPASTPPPPPSDG
ncbi:hypothetical protein [Streptomyces sp. HF10]|uniref:hypothetical protein n=1 Tax=Streptomyces sp. HF10 TaxID=2692233 RepID=UPI001318CBF4|nr:hypothetical protein [Streptomyces sp. HF10]QHC32113.1 hypothetical protein GR129_28245 [Streptomyces sp. HF10]